MPKGKPAEQWQISYIEQNYQHKTVNEMSAGTGLSAVVIYVLCNSKCWAYKKAKPKGKLIKYVPSPVFKREAYIPDPPREKIIRPKAVYDNLPSPYGISQKLR